MTAEHDPRQNLKGGYGAPYDSRPALARLAQGDSSTWQELWEELHQQGDVGEASYAAVLDLVRIHAVRDEPDWNTYALIATIEIARLSGRNPPLPAWLTDDYRQALVLLESLGRAQLSATDDEDLISCILAVLALGKGQVALARMAMLTESERQEMLDSAGWG